MATVRSQPEGASPDLLRILSSAFRRIGALEIDQGILAQARASSGVTDICQVPPYLHPLAHQAVFVCRLGFPCLLLVVMSCFRPR